MMDVAGAYKVVKSLELSQRQERQLAQLLQGTGRKKTRGNRRRPVLTVAHAERMFRTLLDKSKFS